MDAESLEWELSCYKEYINEGFDLDNLTIGDITEFMELLKRCEYYWASLERT